MTKTEMSKNMNFDADMTEYQENINQGDMNQGDINQDNMAKYRSKLEYPKVVARLAEYASFAVSRELLLNIKPKKDITAAKREIDATTEGVELLRLHPLYTVGTCRDIRDALRRVELGGALDVEQLVMVADTCRASRHNKEFFSQLKGHFPQMVEQAHKLGIFKTIETAVDKAVGPDGQIADGASVRLSGIRQRIRMYEGQIKERLDNFIKNPNTAKFLQEPIVTLRGGRFVVPVKQEYRGSVAGAVHDVSGSGATVFVEPLAVMQANNELARLRSEEQDEIAAILRALSAVVASFGEELERSLWGMARMDFVIAKARLAYAMEAVPCQLNSGGLINLKQARHPLIPGRAVPIDVKLDSKLRVMVITGPNTGGKTVTLKTVGLLTLMALSGLHIPAEMGSTLAFYGKIFADIGDEQSIEQSLSTFSAHMTGIVDILRQSDDDSLVLLDELGSGTDPTEGAALAMSILEHLHRLGAKTLATTHYSELKSFAYNKSGYINASVEFDVETLSPTYRLLMGIPGRSNAFLIADKLGLQPEIIERANSFLTADEQQVADLISGLEENRLQAEQARREADIRLAEVAEQQRILKNREVELANREADIITKARLQAAEIVNESRRQAEELYQQMKAELKNSAQGNGSLQNKSVQGARTKMRQLQEKLQNDLPAKRYQGEAPTQVELGQAVEIPKLHQSGVVISLPDSRGDIQVQIGVMKVKVKLSDLRPDKRREEKETTGRTKMMMMSKARSISTEIDLHGMTVDEATHELDKYLDDAYLANLRQVRVIHGRGTGALKTGVTAYLRKHPLVARVTPAPFSEGGIGATVVEFK